MNALLQTSASISGKIGAGSVVIGDYTINMEPIAGGHRLTVTRGTEVQTMDLMDGAPGRDAPQESVLYTSQILTDDQQDQARHNVGAVSVDEFDKFQDEIVASKDSATENTRFAIGTAGEAIEVPSMEEFNELKGDMAGKLTEPAEGLAVGKYFRVAAIDENGHAVLEAVDAPVGGVQDVQVNGESIVANGVANVPMTNNTTIPGVLRHIYGTLINNLGDISFTRYNEITYDNSNFDGYPASIGTLKNYRHRVVKDAIKSIPTKNVIRHL